MHYEDPGYDEAQEARSARRLVIDLGEHDPPTLRQLLADEDELAMSSTEIATERAFGRTVHKCPDCGHGIDPHGTNPGGACGVSKCGCLMQPNGIVELLLDSAIEDGRVAGRRQMCPHTRIYPGSTMYCLDCSTTYCLDCGGIVPTDGAS